MIFDNTSLTMYAELHRPVTNKGLIVFVIKGLPFLLTQMCDCIDIPRRNLSRSI